MCILNILQTTDYTILELNEDNIVERQASAMAVDVAVAASSKQQSLTWIIAYISNLMRRNLKANASNQYDRFKVTENSSYFTVYLCCFFSIRSVLFLPFCQFVVRDFNFVIMQ